jgi:hypothetical protein
MGFLRWQPAVSLVVQELVLASNHPNCTASTKQSQAASAEDTVAFGKFVLRALKTSAHQ